VLAGKRAEREREPGRMEPGDRPSDTGPEPEVGTRVGVGTPQGGIEDTQSRREGT
jgi:hypothetical protein